MLTRGRAALSQVRLRRGQLTVNESNDEREVDAFDNIRLRMLMSPRKLGTVIKQLREKRGMTQKELAKRSGVSQGYIAKLEPSNRQGQPKEVRHHNPSLDVLKRLARALGVPVGELLE